MNTRYDRGSPDVSPENSSRRIKKELDEKTLQQLRGIFAAHDEDRDLMLTKAQLAETIRALGFSPTEDLISKFLRL